MTKPLPPRAPASPGFRARRVFWVLVVLAVLATGSLTTALAAPPGTVTALRVAVSGLVAMISVTLATRVMIALQRPGKARTR